MSNKTDFLGVFETEDGDYVDLASGTYVHKKDIQYKRLPFYGVFTDADGNQHRLEDFVMGGGGGGGEGGTTRHSLLREREFHDQHPISAITDLDSTLNSISASVTTEATVRDAADDGLESLIRHEESSRISELTRVDKFARIKVKNTTGELIRKTTPIYISSNDVDVLFDKSRSDDDSTSLVDYFVETDMPDNTFGYAIIRAIFSHNTVEEGWNTFDTLYLAPTGGITNVQPTGNVVRVGFVLSDGLISLDKSAPRDDFPDTYIDSSSGYRAFNRHITLNNRKITGVASGTLPSDVVNHAQLKQVADRVDGITGAPQVIGSVSYSTDMITHALLNSYCEFRGLTLPPPANTAINDSDGAPGAHQWRWIPLTEAWVDVGAQTAVIETPETILEKITSVDGIGSGLDTEYFQGRLPSTFATAAQGLKADTALQNITNVTDPNAHVNLDISAGSNQSVINTAVNTKIGDIATELATKLTATTITEIVVLSMAEFLALSDRPATTLYLTY